MLVCVCVCICVLACACMSVCRQASRICAQDEAKRSKKHTHARRHFFLGTACSEQRVAADAGMASFVFVHDCSGNASAR